MTQSEPAGSSAGEVDEPLKHSPLEASHIALGAKMVGFGGWLMPLSYPGGTISEHQACRSDAVAFDVSHLGTVRVAGDEAYQLLQDTLSNDLTKISPGRAQYTHLLEDQDGSVTDDIIVWWLKDDVFDVMPNASNTSRVSSALGGEDTTSRARGDRDPRSERSHEAEERQPQSSIRRPISGSTLSNGADVPARSQAPGTQARTESSAQSPSRRRPHSGMR